MEKKYFETPYLKVVRVHNDIIATSFGSTNESVGATSSDYKGGYAPDREDWDEDGEW